MKRLSRAILWLALLGLTGGAFSTSAGAEDRALLIGVGHYRNIPQDLPGIDLDIKMMQEMAELLGFTAVKALRDEEATLANVEKILTTWLMPGMTERDRVLIYFSGHGSFVADTDRDEEDGRDEVLLMHDVQVNRKGGRAVLENALLDDRLGEWLAKMPSRNKLVIVDSCHSGTSVRTLTAFVSPSLGATHPHTKFFFYEGMPAGEALPKANPIVDKPSSGQDANLVALTAARDDQQSIATSEGSLFTRVLYQTVRQAAQQSQPSVTPAWLRDTVEQRLAQVLQGSNRMFNPQLVGSTELANRPLQMAALAGGHGPQWQQLADLVSGAEPLTVSLNQPRYAQGDNLVITVDVPRQGYLNVVHVGPDDEATVLFPNQFEADNQVAGGRIVIPTERMTFDLKARPPYGPSLIVALLAPEPVNLYQSGQASRDGKGNILDVFSTTQPHQLKQLRSFAVEQKEQRPRLVAGMVETRVCQQPGGC